MRRIGFRKGELVSTPNGRGRVVETRAKDQDRVTVTLETGDLCRFYSGFLLAIPQWNAKNPKIDVYTDGKYQFSTQWHKSIGRIRAWWSRRVGVESISNVTFKIDHNK